MRDTKDREKYPSELAERFQIRLPPGLRDRIKAYAELQGRSMNTEIVRVLESEFPEPEGIEHRIGTILGLTDLLRAGADRGDINHLVTELVDTVRAISDGRVQGVDDVTRDRISTRLERWEEEAFEDEHYRSTEGLDQVEVDALSRGRSKAKYPLDPEWRYRARELEGISLSEDEFEIYKRGYRDGLAARHEPMPDQSVPFEDDT
jgi:hypothetical protein